MFVLREALIGLKRNGTASMISIGVMFFSLLLLGIFLIITFNLFGIIKIAQSKVEIDVFLVDDIGTDTVKELEAKLKKIVGVKSVDFVSKEQALKEIQEELKDVPDLLEALETNPLPASFRIRVEEGYNNAKDIADIAKKIGMFKEVEDVKYGEEWVPRLDKLVKILFLFDILVGFIISVASIYVTSNTIRLTVISRKESIEIMKLVGATDRMIRAPFILEGIIQGMVGGFLSAGTLYGLYMLSSRFVSYYFPQNYILGGLVILGMILGYIGSKNAVKTYLTGGEI